MTRLILGVVTVYILCALLLAGSVLADPTPALRSQGEIEKRFLVADRNGDGALSRQEMEQAGWMAKEQDRFNTLDSDHSGTVTLAEIGSAVAAQVRQWLAADTDRDGRVSAQEAQSGSLGATFRTIDDGDGYLTTQELEHFGQRNYYEQGELPSVAPNIIEKRF